MRLASALSAVTLLLSGFVAASNVIDLDTDNFESYVGGSKPALVEFYAPWCGHCKNLAPTFDKLADAFPSQKVVIAKTDADGVGRALGERYGVTGFPTLKWFPANSMTPEDYKGGRDLESLVAFVTEKAGTKSSIKAPPPPAAVELDAGNFNKIALDSTKNVLVAFTAPWCGHCKSMKPAYEKVAQAFKSESDCVVAQMNADDEQNRPISGKYGVTSFPTIQFFPKGSSSPVPYNMGRTEEQFVEFLNEHCGTHRTATGGLNELAGKVLPLDRLASAFFTSAVPDRTAILAKAKEMLGSMHSVDERANKTASYYVRAMERVVEKGESWLVKEQGRIANLLASPSMAPTKLDELKIKANILSSFAIKKFEDAVEYTEELAEEAIKFAQDGAQVVQDQAKVAGDKAGEAYGDAKAKVEEVAGDVQDKVQDATGTVKAKVQEATGRVKAEL